MKYRIASRALGRRSLLKGAGALALAAGLPACLPGLAHAAAQAAARAADLPNPEEAHAKQRRLKIAIQAKFGDYELAGKRVRLRGYDGLKAPRTLRLHAGDTLDLDLTNAMPPQPAAGMVVAQGGQSAGMHASHDGHASPGPEIPGRSGLNVPHGFNLTNMHVHGLHVSPKSPADNVLITVNSGETQHYSYPIPKNHPCGLNFYHAHQHGSVALQVASGMAGAIVIEGKVDAIRDIRKARERIILLQALPTDANGRCDDYATLDNDPGVIYLNGERAPVITMKPGEVQRWRIVNATHNRFPTLTLPKHQLVALGYDGNPLERTQPVEQVTLAPGNRVEMLVKAPEGKGDYTLSAGGNYGVDYGAIATVRVEGSHLDAWTHLYDGPLVDYAKDFDGHLKPIEDCDVVKGRRIGWGQIGTLPHWTWTIDGKPFAADKPGFTSILGTAEEWVLENQTNDPHPFHIHINPIYVMEVDGKPLNRWLDTIAVPPNGKVRLRTRFLDYDGVFVFHCHTLVHEDQGMMRKMTVVKA